VIVVDQGGFKKGDEEVSPEQRGVGALEGAELIAKVEALATRELDAAEVPVELDFAKAVGEADGVGRGRKLASRYEPTVKP
jgi:hypothetical protein